MRGLYFREGNLIAALTEGFAAYRSFPGFLRAALSWPDVVPWGLWQHPHLCAVLQFSDGHSLQTCEAAHTPDAY